MVESRHRPCRRRYRRGSSSTCVPDRDGVDRGLRRASTRSRRAYGELASSTSTCPRRASRTQPVSRGIHGQRLDAVANTPTTTSSGSMLDNWWGETVTAASGVASLFGATDRSARTSAPQDPTVGDAVAGPWASPVPSAIGDRGLGRARARGRRAEARHLGAGRHDQPGACYQRTELRSSARGSRPRSPRMQARQRRQPPPCRSFYRVRLAYAPADARPESHRYAATADDEIVRVGAAGLPVDIVRMIDGLAPGTTRGWPSNEVRTRRPRERPRTPHRP